MKRFIDWLGNKTDSTALKERYYLERDVTNETKNKKIHKKQKNIMSERQRERTMKQRSVWVLGSKWV